MNLSNEQSVASILISLTDKQATADSHPSIDYQNGDMKDALYISYNASSHELANKTIQSLRSHIASILSDDEELEGSHALLNIDKTQCTSSELEIIRRERNRMHAKKTRLRKKKMLQEMEAVSMIFITLAPFIFLLFITYLLNIINCVQIVCKLQNEIRLLVESRVAQISSYSGSGSIVKKESPTITAALENVTSLFESNKKQRTSSDLMASTYTSSAITHTNQPQQIFDNSAPAEVSQVILNGLLSLGNSSVSLHEQHAYSSSSDEASSFKSPLELSRERSRY